MKNKKPVHIRKIFNKKYDKSILGKKKVEELNRLPFAIEIIPNFKKPDKKQIAFIKKYIEMRKLPFKEFYDKDLKIEINCYLQDTNVKTTDAAKIILKILEGVAFKDIKQVKEVNTAVKDVKIDPFNDPYQPFIGIVLKKVKKYTLEEAETKKARWKEMQSELRSE